MSNIEITYVSSGDDFIFREVRKRKLLIEKYINYDEIDSNGVKIWRDRYRNITKREHPSLEGDFESLSGITYYNIGLWDNENEENSDRFIERKHKKEENKNRIKLQGKAENTKYKTIQKQNFKSNKSFNNNLKRKTCFVKR